MYKWDELLGYPVVERHVQHLYGDLYHRGGGDRRRRDLVCQ